MPLLGENVVIRKIRGGKDRMMITKQTGFHAIRSFWVPYAFRLSDLSMVYLC